MSNPPAPNEVYRERLTALYAAHDPSKLQNVEDLLRRFAGHEEALVRTVERKHAQQAQQQQPEQTVEAPLRRRSPEASTPPESVAQVSPRSSIEPEHTNKSPSPAVLAAKASSLPRHTGSVDAESNVNSYRARLTRLYEAHAPLRVSRVDHELERYKDREEEVIQAAVARFGPEPPVLVKPLTIPALSPNEMSEITIATSEPPNTSVSLITPSTSYRSRAVELYRRYDPTKTHKVDAQLAKFKGREEAYLKALEKKLKVSAGEGEEERENTTAVASTPAAPSAIKATTANTSTPPARQAAKCGDLQRYTQRLVQIYERYAPDRAHRAARQLERYPGREEEVIQAAVLKYGPEPTTIDAARSPTTHDDPKKEEEGEAGATTDPHENAAELITSLHTETALSENAEDDNREHQRADAAAAEAKAREEAAAAAEAKAREEAAAAAEAKAREEAAAAAEAKAREEAAAAAEAKAREEAAAAAEAKAREEAAAAAEAKAREEAAAAAESKAREEAAAAAEAKAREEAAAAAEAKAREEAAAAAEAKAREEAAAAAEAKAHEEEAVRAVSVPVPNIPEHVALGGADAPREVTALTLFPAASDAECSSATCNAAGEVSSAVTKAGSDALLSASAAVLGCVAHTPVFELTLYDFFRVLGTVSMTGEEVVTARVAATLLGAISAAPSCPTMLRCHETDADDAEACVTEAQIRECVLQLCAHEAEADPQRREQRAAQSVHRVVTRMADFVKRCRHAVLQMRKQPAPLTAGFWVHRSVQPRVVVRWSRCWARLSIEQNALCLCAPGSMKTELHIPFARVVRCYREGRAAGAPPVFARNGIALQLTTGNPPLRVVVCPESLEACESLLASVRAWKKANRKTSSLAADETRAVSSLSSSSPTTSPRCLADASFSGATTTIRVWCLARSTSYEQQGWTVEDDCLRMTTFSAHEVQTCPVADIASIVGNTELPVLPPLRTVCGFMLCLRSGAALLAFTEHPQERSYVLERLYQSQLLLQLSAAS